METRLKSESFEPLTGFLGFLVQKLGITKVWVKNLFGFYQDLDFLATKHVNSVLKVPKQRLKTKTSIIWDWDKTWDLQNWLQAT